MRLITLLYISFFSIFVNGECSFNTSDFLSDLNNPKSINKIEVEIPKSAKFNRNFAKIISARSENIPPDLKKNFRANVTVHYNFGICKYLAKVKQHGDLRDHVIFSNGMPHRSIKVNLQDGNILNAVKFSLLIPETRNNTHEILGSVFLRELGFIAPETFQVRAVINNVDATMLFQEGIQKELLERHGKREGPLFEGDESLLWSFEDYEMLKLKSLSLALVSNPNWFLKGGSSQDITLSAYSQLQRSYLLFAQNLPANPYTIFPNLKSDSIFEDYFFSMLAMNGSHALYTNNRRYYFNSFTKNFEPIYYDGNLFLDKKSKYDEAILAESFRGNYIYPYKSLISSAEFQKKVFDAFKLRVVTDQDEVVNFFEKSFSVIEENITNLQSEIDLIQFFPQEDNFSEAYEQYVKREQNFKLSQKKIVSISPSDLGNFQATDYHGDNVLMKPEELADILSKNEFKQQRAVFIPFKSNQKIPSLIFKTYHEALRGYIVGSKNIDIRIDNAKKKILIIQSTPVDWLMLLGVNLSGWDLEFKGLNVSSLSDVNAQRFNSQGMTGCLNIYDAILHNTSFTLENGQCEDSLNIISSSGRIKNINIRNAFADAIDFDFSELTIDLINVLGAGNDCLDVSGGVYELKTSDLRKCSDKGISVGEKSSFTAGTVRVENAALGVASKDFSNLHVTNAVFINSPVCVEATQKKQEFGGAIAKFSQINCTGAYIKDKNSTIIRGQ